MQGLITIIFLFCIVSSCSCRTLDSNGASCFNVLDYGAVGDGQTDDSQAFQKAWGQLCEATGGTPALIVPASKTFLLKPVIFRGPCKSNNVHVQIQGTLVAPKSIESWGSDEDKWIKFSDVNGLIIDGGGQIDGKGAAWWKACGEDGQCSRPTALGFHNCNDLHLSGLRHVNSQKNHISINRCNGASVSNLQILAPESSPNTDGIDISASSNVFIQNSVIGTGDDCIAINGFCSNISISGILCGPGHGISIGSLGRNGAYETVEDVQVRNCTFKGTQNGARIKTWKGGKGYARRISFEQITLIDSENPIIIDQYYSMHSMNGVESDIQISDIAYRGVHGSSADEKAINLDCCNGRGCTNIIMEDVRIGSSTPGKPTYAFCNNAHGKSVSASPDVPCLSK